MRSNSQLKKKKADLLFASIIVILLADVFVINLFIGGVRASDEIYEYAFWTKPQNWQTNTTIFPEISGYNLTFAYRDHNFEGVWHTFSDHQIVSLYYHYSPLSNESANHEVWIRVVVNDAKIIPDAWEFTLCSPIQPGPDPILDSRDVQILQNPPLSGRFYTFRDYGEDDIQVTLYWYLKVRNITGATTQPICMIACGQRKYVIINLFILTENQNDVPALEEELLVVGQLIAESWEPWRMPPGFLFLIDVVIPVALVGTLIFGVCYVLYTVRKRLKNLNQHTTKPQVTDPIFP